MTRKTKLSDIIVVTVTTAMLGLSPLARAEIVQTQELATVNQAELDRAKVQSFVERATVKEKLEAMGVGGLLAKDRVAALSEQEVHALAERIDAMPAGGSLSQMDMVIILLVAILVAIAI
ncbi:PA2779 family protein [Limnohabitans sp.]|uniref:PA2779 family protein n=1 Tax=Limnohabitans sp. TaxID=1907725 RepID=UPI00286EBF3C|nr:PA2779 family protein [Limnohabitans sp.]